MTARLRLLVVAALLFVPLAVGAQRLPGGVTPDHYDLAFTIDLPNARFDGKTGIDVRLAQPATAIKLNALELDIRNASVSAGGQSQTAAVTMNESDQTATLTVPRPIPAGTARIEIAYSAPLNSLYIGGRNSGPGLP